MVSYERSAEEGRRLKKVFERMEKVVIEEAEAKLYQEALQVEADAVLMVPVDTGMLRNSLGTRKVGYADFEVGSKVHYAESVERGSQRSRPQPYLKPALAKNRENIRKAIRGAMYKGVRKR